MARIKFQEPLKGRRIDIERLEDRLRGNAAFDQPIGDEQAARRLAPRIKFGQAGKGKVDRGQTILAAFPLSGRVLDVAQYRWRNLSIIGDAEKAQKADRVGIRGEPLTVGFVPIPLGQDSPRPEN